MPLNYNSRPLFVDQHAAIMKDSHLCVVALDNPIRNVPSALVWLFVFNYLTWVQMCIFLSLFPFSIVFYDESLTCYLLSQFGRTSRDNFVIYLIQIHIFSYTQSKRWRYIFSLMIYHNANKWRVRMCACGGCAKVWGVKYHYKFEMRTLQSNRDTTGWSRQHYKRYGLLLKWLGDKIYTMANWSLPDNYEITLIKFKLGKVGNIK